MIEVNTNSYEVGPAAIMILLFLFVGLWLAIRPTVIVKLLGRWTRKYQQAVGLSDDQLDKAMRPFQRSMLGGSPARFAKTAPDKPEEFPALIAYVRVFGVLITVAISPVLCLALAMFVLSLFVGRAP